MCGKPFFVDISHDLKLTGNCNIFLKNKQNYHRSFDYKIENVYSLIF